MRFNQVLCLVTFTCMAGSPVCGRQPVTFAASTIDPGGSGDCKAIADLDGDGKGDAIVGGSPLNWYEAGAGFAKHVIRASPVYAEFTTDMQAADVDGDTDIDLIIPDSGPNNTGTIFWFENPRLNPPAGLGADPRIGSNWARHTIGIHGAVVHDVEVADLDNDGKLDIVSSGHGQTHIWRQVSPTSWSERNLNANAGEGVSIGDIDRDGFRDIATPRGWLRNPRTTTGAWTFNPISQATSGDECLVVDLNRDGRLDLLTCDAHAPGLMLWFQAPATPTSPTWTRRTIDDTMGAHHPEAADFDRDGNMDILMGLELTDLSIYMNNGAAVPVFQKVQLDDRCAHNARAGDMDNDGLPDVLGCDYIGNPPARVYINQLTGPAPCYANCDNSEGIPLLTSNDFQCFINAFVGGLAYANCDASTGSPLLTGNDFLCFINAYAAGCP